MIGLTLRGSIHINGGSFISQNCIFDGENVNETHPGIRLVSGSALLEDTDVIHYKGGGISVTSGSLRMLNGRILSNGNEPSSSTFGGIEVSRPGGAVVLSNTTVEDNGRPINSCAGASCMRGGGLLVAGGQARVNLTSGTKVCNNVAFEGDDIYVDTAFAQAITSSTSCLHRLATMSLLRIRSGRRSRSYPRLGWMVPGIHSLAQTVGTAI